MPYPFRDRTLQFQTLRALGCANSGAADCNEIFELCGRISSLADWFREWREAGRRAFRHGELSEQLGDLVSAKEAFLRACNYLRTAEFFRRENPAEDKEALECYEQSREAFGRAMRAAAAEYDFTEFDVAFEGGAKLPVYLVCPKGRQKEEGPRRPTVVTVGGYDGTKEEAFIGFGAAALARGFNYVAFDGPGQGAVIRQQRVPFRADWHVVLTAVTDALVEREEIDKDKMVLAGISFGSWLAAQALTREHRFAAAVLDGGVWDFASSWRKRVPWFVWSLLKRQRNSLVSTMVSLGVRIDIGRKWGYQNGLWTFGVSDGAQLLTVAQQYCLTEQAVRQIRTPLLVFDPQNDHLLGGQAPELIKHLGPEQSFHHFRFDTRFGAGEHCEKGAQGEHDRAMYNWLAARGLQPAAR